MLGDFAGSVIFVCGMLGWALLATSILAYAAHCVTVIVTDTAAGLDEVRWPTELMVDWIGGAFRFFVLLATVLIAPGIYLRVAGSPFLSDSPILGACATIGVWLWAFFPVALLSAMAAGSPYHLIHFGVLRELIRALPSVLLFYLVTALGAGLVGFLWYETLPGGEVLALPLAAAAGAAGLLTYARLIGRVGWLITNAKPSRKKRPTGKLKPRLRKRIRVSDPWAAPEEEESEGVELVAGQPVPPAEAKPVAPVDDDEWAPPVPYGLGNDAPAKPPKLELIEGSPYLEVKMTPVRTKQAPPPPSKSRNYEADDEPLPMRAEEPVAPAAKLDVQASTLDMRVARVEDDIPPPDFPMFSGVYSFPFYSTSLRAFFVLFFSSIALGAGLIALVGVFPGGR